MGCHVYSANPRTSFAYLACRLAAVNDEAPCEKPLEGAVFEAPFVLEPGSTTNAVVVVEVPNEASARLEATHTFMI